MYSLDGGLQTLTDRLAESVREMSGDIKLDSPVTSLEFTTGKAKVKILIISNMAQNNYMYVYYGKNVCAGTCWRQLL